MRGAHTGSDWKPEESWWFRPGSFLSYGRFKPRTFFDRLQRMFFNLTGANSHGQLGDPFAVVEVSLKQVQSFIVFNVQWSKRMLSLATIDVSSCFARRMIELAKYVLGLNRPLGS